MTLVKVCGISDPESAAVAVDSGADMVGVIFAPSRRQVTVDDARAIRARVPAGTQLVGVFVDADTDEVNRIAEQVGLDLVQLSGTETLDDINRIERGVIKVVHLRTGIDPTGEVARFVDVAAHVLLDTYTPDAAGGSGVTGDWAAARSCADSFPVMLAGGLTPDNVSDALDATGAAGVDVSSGVERDGAKDPDLIRAFIHAATRTRA